MAVDGSDANPGTGSAPWRTLQHAAASVPAGGTVLIRNGTYGGFRMTRSGSEAAPITFASYPGERPVISGSETTVNVITLAGVHDIVLHDLVVEGAAAHRSGAGIRVESASSRVRIESSLLRENRSYGVSIVDSTDVTVHDNEITGNAEGVYIQRAGAGVVVSDNDIHHQDRMVVAQAEAGMTMARLESPSSGRPARRARSATESGETEPSAPTTGTTAGRSRYTPPAT